MRRQPAVAGSFYPAEPATLRALVDDLLDQATRAGAGRAAGPASEAGPAPLDAPGARLRGVLVPHAGLEWSGAVAAAGWRCLDTPPSGEPGPTSTSVVLLGTNHSAWLAGVGIWPEGTWRTPLGEVAVDAEVADAIARLGPPFAVNPEAHFREHSIEVQLPLLQVITPDTRVVPLAVSAGTGADALAAGARLGELVAGLDDPARRVLLAISTDLAHYPAHRDAVRVTETLLPPILQLDPATVAGTERGLVQEPIADLVCGMCGIEPTVLGLAALRAAGATRGHRLAAATSADAGGPPTRTVGYLAVAFD